MYGSWNPSQWTRIANATSLLIKKATGLATLGGLLCANSSSLIVVLWDGQDATGALGPTKQLTGQITLNSGQAYPCPAKLNNGLYVQIVSGTGDFTVFWD